MLISNISAIFKVPMEPIFSAPVFHRLLYSTDRRNENGVPYVIHHNDPWQRTYEEDILEDREDIVGHYRVAE